MTVDEYRFLCWLQGEVPSAKIIRDLLRKKIKGANNDLHRGFKRKS